jgi:hypothetical protein
MWYGRSRRMNRALFERTILSPSKVSPLVTQLHPAAESLFKDTYLLDFLDLPDRHSEADLQQALTANLRRFLLELNQTTGDSYTCVPELGSVRHAHEEKPVSRQTCAQRTLPQWCPNILWFDLGRDFCFEGRE